jgi:leader peptidase (prepilin peptidase)/N-methyltransferase
MSDFPWPLLVHPGAGILGGLLGLPLGSFLATAAHRLAYDDESFDPGKGPRSYEHLRMSDLEDLSGLPWTQRIPFLGLLVGMVDFCHFHLLAAPPSCDDCGGGIALADRLPIVGWLRLGGRCRHCAAPIPAQFFWLEVLTPLTTSLAFAAFGLTLEAGLVSVVALLGLLASIVDWNYQIIPDEVPTTGIAIGLGVAVAHTGWALRHGLPDVLWKDLVTHPSMADPWHFSWAVSGALVGGVALWALQVVGARLAGTQAMGSGDVKLAVALGVFTGPKGAGVALFYAAVLGAASGMVVLMVGGGKREEGFTKFAFGPYICLGFLIVMVLGADHAFQLYVETLQVVTGSLVGGDPYGP